MQDTVPIAVRIAVAIDAIICTIHLKVSFFDLFVDFKGYVDFFFFQYLVDDQYSKVLFWLDTPLFIKNPIPKTKEEYFDFINKEINFVERRNKRIEKYIANS